MNQVIGDSYEHVCTALDKWLRERPDCRFCTTGKSFGTFYCRLESRGEETIVARSSQSTNDATANALQVAISAAPIGQ